jgi:hypothetical protein
MESVVFFPPVPLTVETGYDDRMMDVYEAMEPVDPGSVISSLLNSRKNSSCGASSPHESA